jgi:hypothetical protein
VGQPRRALRVDDDPYGRRVAERRVGRLVTKGGEAQISQSRTVGGGRKRRRRLRAHDLSWRTRIETKFHDAGVFS